MKDFPILGLLPKLQTQASAFIKSTTFNGSGTVIAILDTGVDPAAPGLDVCPDGNPKITHIIDCTGSGDVISSDIVESVNSKITGASGKSLTLGNWSNPSGKYHVGIKSCKDLYPKALFDRLIVERKEIFEIEHHKLLTQATKLLESIENSKQDDSSEKTDLKKEYKNRIEILNDQLKDYEDPPLVMDCVWFHDGEHWRVIVDVDGHGDLSKYTPLTDYHIEHQYSSFGNDSMLNFTVNIYDDGDIVSIVTTSGAHGTHVAAITAAYFPNEEHLNGVAPGAQIVSLKIGDNRLGSMETGTGLVRAAIELCRLKVDLANMSFGEAFSSSNVGQFIELVRDYAVNESNIVFVTSAGNAGPALGTVGAPGGATSGVISVGAYVNHSMMDAEYAMLEKVDERPYTWSSRGPSPDGDVGVDIYAPGAAITSVPQFTIQNVQLMNGTSMASPNCCGCLALIISGLKKSGIPYNPYMIKRAIQNSGLDIQDPMNVKFVQVEKMWQYIKELPKSLNFSLHYDVEVNGGRGIYIRDFAETSRINQFNVTVKPKFMNSKDPEQNLLKVQMEAKIVFETSKPWIKVADSLHLNNGGRTFSVNVDCLKLTPGLHFGEIEAYDSDLRNGGPLFKIPVTICKPTSPQNSRSLEGNNFVKFEDVFYPGSITRHFVAVPTSSNFAELTVQSKNRETSSRFYVHMMQLQGQSRYPKFEHDFSFSLNSTQSDSDEDTPKFSKMFKVLPGVTMEVCLAQFWSSLKSTDVSISLKFHGISCAASGDVLGGYGSASSMSDVLNITSGTHGFTRIDVTSHLRKEEIVPSLTLDTIRRVIRPSAEYSLGPLKIRDVLPDSRQIHQISLSFSFKIYNDGTTVTPRVPRVNDILYESCLDNFCLLIFDCNKKLISYQDIYPKGVKLQEGTYTVKIQIKSHSVKILESLNGLPLLLDISLTKSITLPIMSSIADVISDNSSGILKRKTLQRDERLCFFIGDVASLPKNVNYGDILIGKLDLIEGKKLDGALYNVTYNIPPEYKPSTETLVAEKTTDEKVLLCEAIRDLKITWLKKLKSEEIQRELSAELAKENPNFIPLLKAQLENIFKKMESEKNSEELIILARKVIQFSNPIICLIDAAELSKYFGLHQEIITPKDKLISENMAQDKEALLYAQICKSSALYTLLSLKETVEFELLETESMKDFSESLKIVNQWAGETPLNNGKVLLLWSWDQEKKKLYASSLKPILKYLKVSKNTNGLSDPDNILLLKKLEERKQNLLLKLEWDLWLKYEKKWNMTKFPSTYSHF